MEVKEKPGKEINLKTLEALREVFAIDDPIIPKIMELNIDRKLKANLILTVMIGG